MATEVVLTGTGIPLSSPERAGPGTLVRVGSRSLQFDAGRATVMRLCEAGVRPPQLDRLFVTHHHSDHVSALVDLAHTRWMEFGDALRVTAPAGPSVRFCGRALDAFDDDIAVRQEHTGRDDRPVIDVSSFEAASIPSVVSTDGDVRVASVLVHHPPVVPSVAYRIDGPDGAVVISGDTQVCPEVEDLARGAAVLVHEICRVRWLRDVLPPDSPWLPLTDYHADSVALGEMAHRTGVPTLVLTHFAPSPATPEDMDAFVRDVRDGGFTGELVAGPDLTTVRI